MAVYDLEEQDKLEDLRAWWKQWGNTIAGAVVAVCIGVIAVQGWRWWTQHQAVQASVLYNAVTTAVRANDAAKAKDAMAQLADKYGSTGYAPRAALLVASMLFESGDKAGAKAQLVSVIDRDSEDELKQIARLRLASLLLDEKQYDEALRTLDARHDEPFTGVYADLRGDVLAAAGRSEEARTAYQTALAKLDPKSPYRSFVELKLDALGGPTTAIGAAAAGSATPSAAAAGGPATAGASASSTPASPTATSPTPTSPAPASATPASATPASATPASATPAPASPAPASPAAAPTAPATPPDAAAKK